MKPVKVKPKKPRPIRMSFGETLKVGTKLNNWGDWISFSSNTDEFIISPDDCEKVRDWFGRYCKWNKRHE
jgi:hypothetical protein